MSQRMRGPRAKIKRAKKHVVELDDAIKGFRKTEPYSSVRDVDSKPGHIVYRARVTAEPPETISVIAGDAIHNLRSALDLLFWQLIEANNTTPCRNDTFPIFDSRTKGEPVIKREIKKRIGPRATKLLLKLKPYKTGNRDLWRLHKLDIVDKHRLLLAAPSVFHKIVMPFSVPFPPGSSTVVPVEVELAPEERGPLKDGAELTTVPRWDDLTRRMGVKDEHQPEFIFEVALHEPKVVECEPMLPTVSQLASAVEETIELFASARLL